MATGSKFSAGSWVKVWVNQAYRDGIVLACIDNFVLVEYSMPNGTTALREYTDSDFKAGNSTNAWNIATSYRTLSVEWLEAICGADGYKKWTGTPQGKHGKHTRMPKPQEMLSEKKQPQSS